MQTGALRFGFLTLLGALLSAVAGLSLLYLSTLAWQTGEFHTKRTVLQVTVSPIQFYAITIAGALFGAALLLMTPWLCKKVIASPAERERFMQLHPKLYGPTRPSLLIAIGLLCAVGLVAWLRS